MHTCAWVGYSQPPSQPVGETPKDSWRTHKFTHTHTPHGETERRRDRPREISSCWGMKISPTYKKANFGLLFSLASLARSLAKKAQNTENPLPCISQGSRQRLSGQSPRDKRRATRRQHCQQHSQAATATNMRQLPGEFSFVDGVASQFACITIYYIYISRGIFFFN